MLQSSYPQAMPHKTIPQQCYTWIYLRILHTYDIYHHKPATTFLRLSSHGTFAYDVYKEFLRKEQTQALVVDMEDAYNSLQVKLLMELLVQYDVSLTITRWLGKKGCHENWELDLHTPTTDNGTSTRLPTIPSSQQCLHKRTGRSEKAMVQARCLRLWTTGLSAKLPVTFSQQSPLSRSSWKRCHTGAKRQRQIGSMNSLRSPGIHFDMILTYKTQVESAKLRCKKGLSMLKAMASKFIEQRHLFLLYQSVIFRVVYNGLGLTTLSLPHMT